MASYLESSLALLPLTNSGPTLRPSFLRVVHPSQGSSGLRLPSRHFLGPSSLSSSNPIPSYHRHETFPLLCLPDSCLHPVGTRNRLPSQFAQAASSLSFSCPLENHQTYLCVFDWPFLSPDSSTKLRLNFLPTVSHISFRIELSPLLPAPLASHLLSRTPPHSVHPLRPPGTLWQLFPLPEHPQSLFMSYYLQSRPGALSFSVFIIWLPGVNLVSLQPLT